MKNGLKSKIPFGTNSQINWLPCFFILLMSFICIGSCTPYSSASLFNFVLSSDYHLAFLWLRTIIKNLANVPASLLPVILRGHNYLFFPRWQSFFLCNELYNRNYFSVSLIIKGIFTFQISSAIALSSSYL